MFSEDMEAGKTAIAYTDLFVDSAVAKLDAAFGPGYAKANPAALSAYLSTCGNNLHSFMLAATAMQSAGLEEALAAFEEEEDFSPAPPRKGKRGR